MPDKPNLLYICTDQQSATMMSCAGNPWLRTPAMDRLAARGVRFDRAYAANPVCSPARFSMVTGRYPSDIGMRANGKFEVPAEMKQGGLGHCLGRAGYRVAFGGKQHLPQSRAEDFGFEVISNDERAGLVADAVNFLRDPGDKPWSLTLHFINPHDICYQAIYAHADAERQARMRDNIRPEMDTLFRSLQMPTGVDEDTFFAEHCPPLPDNHEPQSEEPEGIAKLLDQRPFRRDARENWTERQWRLHRWAYCRLTEYVDAQISVVLETLDDLQLTDNTVVIFTSDHGDHDASHKLEHKTIPYDQAARIPLIINAPGETQPGRVDRDSLCCNSIDLLPTLCDYAGAEVPTGLPGRSLRPAASGSSEPNDRVVKIEFEVGTAWVDGRYKYVRYDHGDNAEQLYDLQDDPGETRNALSDVSAADAAKKLRAIADEA